MLQTLNDIFTLIDQQVTEKPDLLALKSHDGEFSYSELARAINSAASSIISNGLRAGDFLGCRLDAGSEKVILLLASLKVGVIFVNLPPELPNGVINSLTQDLDI